MVAVLKKNQMVEEIRALLQRKWRRLLLKVIGGGVGERGRCVAESDEENRNGDCEVACCVCVLVSVGVCVLGGAIVETEGCRQA